jgi:hypothetical protein
MQTTKKQCILFAQPCDVSANGFYFASVEGFQKQSARVRNSFGLPVGEYEIEFIEGDELNAQLFTAARVHQGNINTFFLASKRWDIDQKRKVIIAAFNSDYSFYFKKAGLMLISMK